jgi:ABC-type transport system involved in multi-copper enzyme maturation permease subunit
MFRNLLRRQLVDDLLGLRFPIYMLVIVAAAIIFTSIFATFHKDRVENFSRNTIENDRRLESSASSLVNLIWDSQKILMEPSAVRFIADGYEGQMPRGLSVSMSQARLIAQADKTDAVLLNSPDLASVVQIIFSFFALVLTFNAVSLEKEKGTLRLVLSNSVLRTQLLLAKYVGALVTIGIPFLVGLVLSLALLSVGGISVFSGDFLSALALFVVLSLFYLSFFVLLGLLCSMSSGGSKNSLVLCLLCWVFIVVILPKSAGPLLRLRSFSVPTGSEIAEEAGLAGREVWNRHKGENLVTGDPNEESTRLNVKVMNEASQSEEAVFESYLDRKLRSVKTLMAVNCISPASLFEYAASGAAGTGLAHFERFRRQLRRYQRDIVRFFESQDAKDKDSPHLYFHPDYVSKRPFDAAMLPGFKEARPGLGERVRGAAWYGSGLMIYNIILFGLVFVLFQKYDVR